MSKYELSSERLDTEFDHFLLDMKPYVLKHPSKTGEPLLPMHYASKPGLNGKWIGSHSFEFNSAQSAYNYKSQSPNNTHSHTGLLAMSKCFKASIQV